MRKPKEEEEIQPDPEPTSSWFERLKKGLSKTRTAFVGKIQGIFKKKAGLDEELLEELEELLYESDMGKFAQKILQIYHNCI